MNIHYASLSDRDAPRARSQRDGWLGGKSQAPTPALEKKPEWATASASCHAHTVKRSRHHRHRLKVAVTLPCKCLLPITIFPEEQASVHRVVRLI